MFRLLKVVIRPYFWRNFWAEWRRYRDQDRLSIFHPDFLECNSSLILALTEKERAEYFAKWEQADKTCRTLREQLESIQTALQESRIEEKKISRRRAPRKTVASTEPLAEEGS